jgi:aminocarboxymuconate-semialdehyde decarboxylase
MSNMYFDTVLHDKNALSFLIDTVGSERVMMGSDMPFPIGDNNPKDIIKKINIKEEKLILGKVASDLFSL